MAHNRANDNVISSSPIDLDARRHWQDAAENGDAGRQLSVRVRQARLTDIPSLARFSKIYPLLQPELGLSGYRISMSSIRSKSPRSPLKPVVLVAETGERLVAFADFRPVAPDKRWQLRALGAATGVFDPTPVWTQILAAGIRQAGLNGVKRLFAKSPPESNAEVSLMQAGFEAYAFESIFVSDAPVAMNSDAKFREQEPTDTWAIHQLYNASVPKEVLYAEALTSHAWDIGRSRMSRNQNVTGWLVETSAGPVAYLRCVSNDDAHGFDTIFQPGELDAAVSLIDGVLRRLRHERKVGRVFFTIRGYASELEPALVKRGFSPGLTQYLLVRYTAVPVRAVATEPVVQYVELRERVPRRAPSVS